MLSGASTPHGRTASKKTETPDTASAVRGGAAHVGGRARGSLPAGTSRPVASPRTRSAFSIRMSSIVAPSVLSALVRSTRLDLMASSLDLSDAKLSQLSGGLVFIPSTRSTFGF